MSVVLLLLVLIGFAPTLYLRGALGQPPLPSHLYVHGAVLTSWFVWLVVQTSLVGTGRVRVHRQLGVIGAIIGLAVCVAGPLASLNVVGRIRAAGIDLDADVSALGVGGLGAGIPLIVFISRVVWTNLASVAAFFLLLVAALSMRGRPEVHKRLMLLGSVGIVGPAVARIARWPGFGGEQGPFVPLVVIGLLLGIVIYDVYSTRRLRAATLIGLAVVIALGAAGTLIAGSGPGQAFVRGL